FRSPSGPLPPCARAGAAARTRRRRVRARTDTPASVAAGGRRPDRRLPLFRRRDRGRAPAPAAPGCRDTPSTRCTGGGGIRAAWPCGLRRMQSRDSTSATRTRITRDPGVRCRPSRLALDSRPRSGYHLGLDGASRNHAAPAGVHLLRIRTFLIASIVATVLCLAAVVG